MSFAWPHLLFLLLLPLGLLIWEVRRRQQRKGTFHPKILQAEAGQNQLRLQGHGASSHRRARGWLCLGLAFAVVALARPQWGRLEEPVFDQSREILIAIDLSRSMQAQDVKPSRLARAKLLINALLEKLAGERVGLAVFSGTAFLQSPLSADYEILREFLPALEPGFLPEGGTNYRALLETTLQAFGSSNSADRFLIVLSDGEATDENWQELVADLKKKNIRAIGLGIGTPAGAMIPDGSGAFVKDDRGAVVLSRLESKTLQKLAGETGGVYRDASSWIDLAAVLQQTVEAGRKGQFVDKKNVRLVERYQWALAPALLCLLLSFWLEFPVRPRPRALKLAPGNGATIAESQSLVRGTASDSRSGRAGPRSVPLSPRDSGDDQGRALPQKSSALSAVLLALLVGLGCIRPLQAAATEKPVQPELSPLGKIVNRLSGQTHQSGRDWAELARETVTWGQKLQTDQQPVPAGPVHDALTAVDQGSRLDPKTADWTQLRQELEALLQKPEQPQPQQKPEDQPQDQKQSEQDQDKSKQDQKSQSQQGGSPDQSKPGEKPEDQKDQPEQPQDQPAKPPPSSPQQQSAFGDMKEKAPPPPAQGEMQKVGGTPQEPPHSPEQTDPALAMPLQKLQKIKDQDSPAQLFQLMEGKPGPEKPKSGKTW